MIQHYYENLWIKFLNFNHFITNFITIKLIIIVIKDILLLLYSTWQLRHRGFFNEPQLILFYTIFSPLSQLLDHLSSKLRKIFFHPQKLVCHLISNAHFMEKMAQKKNRNEGGERGRRRKEGQKTLKIL